MNLVRPPGRAYKPAVVALAVGRDCSRKSTSEPVWAPILETD